MRKTKRIINFISCLSFIVVLSIIYFTEKKYVTIAHAEEICERISKETNIIQDENVPVYDIEDDFAPLALNCENNNQESNRSALDNKVATIYSSPEEICENILSDETFSIDALVDIGQNLIDANEYYDFSKENKYQIVEWALELGAITEEDAIACLCDLIIRKNFSNIACLEGVLDRIKVFSESNLITDEQLSRKIDNVLNPLSGQTRSIIVNATYSNENFIIHYDSSVDTYSEAQIVGEYCNEIKNKFISMGFSTPILQTGENKYHIYLDPNPDSNGSAAAVTYKVNVSGNTCASYITIFDFSYLNDSVKQCIGHEYFHAIQNAYNHQSGWFKEGCANWGSIVSTGMSTFSDGWLNGYLGSTIPMPELSGYETFALPLTIQREFGGVSAIRKIYESYNNRSSTNLNLQNLREVISEGISNNGYDGGFEIAYRKMAGFLYDPDIWFVNIHSGATAWHNDSIITKSITSSSGSISFSTTVNYLTNQYFKIEIPDSSVCMVKIDVVFSNSDGRIEQYRSQQEGYNILYPNTTSNTATCADSGLGRFVNYSGFVLSNVGNSGSVTCDVTIKLMPQNELFTFWGTGTSRYTERQMYLSERDYADYTVTFSTSGNKVIQTFGTLDTIIELYSLDGTLIDTFDDEGYSQNAFFSYNTVANETYTIRVKFYQANQTGWIRLAITPAYAVQENGVNSLTDYEDIMNIHSYHNFAWYSFAQNNWTRIITFTPPSSGIYTIQLESLFDSYLYVIDPRSSKLNVADLDFNDDGAESFGDAKITRVLEQNIPYFVIYSQYNLSDSFDNLDEGDDIVVRFNIN